MREGGGVDNNELCARGFGRLNGIDQIVLGIALNAGRRQPDASASAINRALISASVSVP